ncbi:MAG: ABC transporter ATP-binding protein [Methylobacterium frigidaeris]
MIRFEGVAKTYPGQARAAVDAVDLTVADGTTVALIGPSGCGKSTLLRMVNRLVDPDAGRVLVGGEDVAGLDPVALRRRVGYVLQGVGLFPHHSVARNVATVPGLLGWPKRRIAERVDAMLDLVGLEPAAYRGRRPDELSGGQRQRVGVARALAADPPVLLMDEPFGAVDPLSRTRLQAEIGEILSRLKKTVVLVTHDLDEAVRLGERVALMRDGRLVQDAAPADLLARPADAFVEDFVGADRLMRRLGLIAAGTVAEPGSAAGLQVLPAGASAREALTAMLASGADRLAVPEAGIVTLAGLRAAARAEAPGGFTSGA